MVSGRKSVAGFEAAERELCAVAVAKLPPDFFFTSIQLNMNYAGTTCLRMQHAPKRSTWSELAERLTPISLQVG